MKQASKNYSHQYPVYKQNALHPFLPSYALCRLVPSSCRFRSRRSTDALLVAAAQLEPLLCAESDFAIKLFAGVLAMDKVAEAAADAALARVEATASFTEVGDGAQFAIYGSGGVPSAVEFIASLLSGIFVFETSVDIADEICSGRES